MTFQSIICLLYTSQNPDVFTEIMIASRTKYKCDAVVKAIGNPNIKTAQVDADNVDAVSYTHLPLASISNVTSI